MRWTVELTNRARKELGRLDRREQRRVIDFLETVQEEPRAQGRRLRGDLAQLWRYRVGAVRILCELQDQELLVLVVSVKRRDQAYR